MDNHRPLFLPRLVDEIQIKSDGQLKVELDGGALMRSTKSVHNCNVDLGAVKRTISWVQRPFLPEFVQALCKSLFGEIPGFNLSQVLVGPSGQAELESKSKNLRKNFISKQSQAEKICSTFTW